MLPSGLASGRVAATSSATLTPATRFLTQDSPSVPNSPTPRVTMARKTSTAVSGMRHSNIATSHRWVPPPHLTMEITSRSNASSNSPPNLVRMQDCSVSAKMSYRSCQMVSRSISKSRTAGAASWTGVGVAGGAVGVPVGSSVGVGVAGSGDGLVVASGIGAGVGVD